MSEIFIGAAAQVTAEDLPNARLGPRFGRLDRASQLALLAVESLAANFDAWPRERIGICLAARAGSLSTDVEYWNGRDAVGGPSPMLFTYTLPSSAIGEIAIRHRITGPNLCIVGEDTPLLAEGAAWLLAGEVDACVCVSCREISPEASRFTLLPAEARAGAVLLQREGPGLASWSENDRDMTSLLARILPAKN